MTWQIAREDFIACNRHKSVKWCNVSYVCVTVDAMYRNMKEVFLNKTQTEMVENINFTVAVK
jgi:hypothetical protein